MIWIELQRINFITWKKHSQRIRRFGMSFNFISVTARTLSFPRNLNKVKNVLSELIVRAIRWLDDGMVCNDVRWERVESIYSNCLIMSVIRGLSQRLFSILYVYVWVFANAFTRTIELARFSHRLQFYRCIFHDSISCESCIPTLKKV